MRDPLGTLKRIAPPLCTVVLLLVVWSIYVRRAAVSPFVLPAPEAIAAPTAPTAR